VSSATTTHPAHIQDAADEYDAWKDYEQQSDNDSIPSPPPEAPSPPSADQIVNVFDFLLANSTPTASVLPVSTSTSVPNDWQGFNFEVAPDALDHAEDALGFDDNGQRTAITAADYKDTKDRGIASSPK